MGKPFLKELSRLGTTYNWAMNHDIGPLVSAVLRIRHLPLIATGSGGSLTGAYIAAQQHENRFGFVSKAVTPLEFIYSKASLHNVGALFVTAGGRNVDILSAFQSVVDREARQVLILCADATSEVVERAEKYDFVDVLTFDLPSGRDGFLATNSLFAFSTLLLRAWAAVGGAASSLPDDFAAFALDISDQGEDISVDAQNVWNTDTIVVLHGPATKAAVVDLESKFTEAALGSIQSADYRNFAHGRHHWLAERGDRTSIVAFISDGDRELAAKTLSLIPESIPILKKECSGGNDRVVIESLLQTFLLTASAGRACGIDPGRPHVPMFGRKLYHLRANKRDAKAKPQLAELAIQRKTGRTIEDLDSTNELANWQEAHNAFLTGVMDVKYGAIVLDYDGTLCSHHSRYEGMSAEIAGQLISLLEQGIHLGIATGRGGSVQEDFWEKVPERLWGSVLVGYYNGGILSYLNEEFNTDLEIDTEIAALDTAFRKREGLSYIFGWTTKCVQIELEPKRGYSAVTILRLVRQIAESEGLSGLKVLSSSHSVDVVAARNSKVNVVARLQQILGTDKKILRVGDRGQSPGNDCLLLSDEYSLSVDECSLDSKSCWNLTQAGQRGVSGTLEYLNNLATTNGECYFQQTFGALRI